MNDINKETHFQYSDYTLPKFTPFCATPPPDPTKDCVAQWISSMIIHMTPDTSAIDKTSGCLQDFDCSLRLPYICKIKNPACDDQTLLFKDYLVALLSDVSQTSTECSGTCSSGLATFFKPEPTKAPTIKRVLKRKTVKGKRKRFGSKKKFLSSGRNKN